MKHINNLIKCPNCHYLNRKGSQYCKNCNHSLAAEAGEFDDKRKIITGWFARKLNRILDVADDYLDALSIHPSTSSQAPISQAQSSVGNIKRGSQKPDHGDMYQSNREVSSKQPGEIIGFYKIVEVIPLKKSNYYKVHSIRCENCGIENWNNPQTTCSKCQISLRRYVLKETYTQTVIQEATRGRIIQLSGSVNGILKHNDILYFNDTQYILLDGFPEPWFCLGDLRELPIGDDTKISTWLTQIGDAINGLHKSGYHLNGEDEKKDWIESILILKNQRAYLADISGVVPFQANQDQAKQDDLQLLVRILFTVLTGRDLDIFPPKNLIAEVPVAYRELIDNTMRGVYPSVDDFLSSLRQIIKSPGVVRSLRQLVGYGTDVGRLRDHNEDYVSKFSLGLEQIPGTPEIGLYIVADGMGGHQAGEKASESVIKDVVINRIQEKIQQLQSVPKLKRATVRLDDILTPGEILHEAILQANQVLVNVRKSASGSDRGTTITAALIIGDKCTVANVGDSRTYLLRRKQLEQITEDHSVVAKLVASKSIKPSEVRSHPKRNQILRTLGDNPQVEVDLFEKTLEPGDKLLLCSDGLWEMVLDDEMEKILNDARTPQSACDHLIKMANANGGEDNISVVVVWLE